MDKFLPIWIIGAPFLYLVVDWIMTPKSNINTRDPGQYSSAGAVR